ncbi:hypothetical protein GCM10027275_43740 [Rhabdobacter roseus]
MGKVELGYFQHQSTLVNVEPGPEWKGHYLRDRLGIYAKSGVLLMQQASLVPFRLGVRLQKQ